MKNSAQRIRTSHVGRLPVPSGFEETALRLACGDVGDEEVAAQVVPVVADVVKRQVAIGLDCIGDGECWSAHDSRWFDQQMTGLGTRPLKPGEVGSMRESTRERDVFRTLYADMHRVGYHRLHPGRAAAPADARARHRQRAHQDQRYRRDATPARLLQGGDRALGRRRRRGFRVSAGAWMARPFHL